jgi:hypothetical protein
MTASVALTLGVVGVAPANAIRLDFDKNVDETIEDYKEGYILRGDEWADWGIDISVDVNKNRSFQNNQNTKTLDRLTLYNTDPTKQNHRDTDLRTGAYWGTNPDKNDPNSHHGNVLIIQTDNQRYSDGRYKPNDDASGGKITFNFLEANENYIYENLKIGLLDIDNSEKSWVTVYYLDGEGQERSQKLTLEMEKEQLSYADAGVSLISNPETTILTGHNDNSLWEFNFDFLNQELDSLMSISRIDVEYKASGGVAYVDYDRIAKEIYGEGDSARVPEPSSALALLAVGALGGGSILKRKQQ